MKMAYPVTRPMRVALSCGFASPMASRKVEVTTPRNVSQIRFAHADFVCLYMMSAMKPPMGRKTMFKRPSIDAQWPEPVWLRPGKVW